MKLEWVRTDSTQLKQSFTEANKLAQEFHHTLSEAGIGAGKAFGFDAASLALRPLGPVEVPCGPGAAPAALQLAGWAAAVVVVPASCAGGPPHPRSPRL